MDIQDKVTIVTGASEGIGLAIAQALRKEGALLVLAARSEEKLLHAQQELPGSMVVPTDMRDAASVQKLITSTIDRHGRIDLLVNNAGQGLRSAVETIDIEQYKDVMELNVFAVLRAMQLTIPIMRSQGGGMILNISSMVSKNYYPYLGGYASTKYALNALSLTAREELAPEHIVVSVFHPKMTATRFGANAQGETYESSAGRPGMVVDTAEQVAQAVLAQIRSEEAEAHM